MEDVISIIEESVESNLSKDDKKWSKKFEKLNHLLWMISKTIWKKRKMGGTNAVLNSVPGVGGLKTNL